MKNISVQMVIIGKPNHRPNVVFPVQSISCLQVILKLQSNALYISAFFSAGIVIYGSLGLEKFTPKVCSDDYVYQMKTPVAEVDACMQFLCHLK